MFISSIKWESLDVIEMMVLLDKGFKMIFGSMFKFVKKYEIIWGN